MADYMCDLAILPVVRWRTICYASHMHRHDPLLTFALFTFAFGPVATAQQLVGHVYGGGHPVAQSTVTLWAAGQAAPTKLSETQTKDDGAFALKFDTKNAGSNVLYLIAAGGESRIGGS